MCGGSVPGCDSLGDGNCPVCHGQGDTLGDEISGTLPRAHVELLGVDRPLYRRIESAVTMDCGCCCSCHVISESTYKPSRVPMVACGAVYAPRTSVGLIRSIRPGFSPTRLVT